MSDRPNVLLLLTDDQRFDTIAAMGNPAIHTPNLDRLVTRGAAFERAYIMGGSSGAVCMPSRAMLHTGRTLYHIDEMGQDIHRDHLMIGEHLQRAGYDTFGTGKWHNGPEAFARSFTAGAEVFFGGMSDHWNVPVCDFSPDGKYPEPTEMIMRWGQHLVQVTHPCDRFATGTHSTDLFVDSTCRWLAQRDPINPFFAYIAFMAPHDPREMPAQYLAHYDPEKIQLPPNFMPEHPFDTGHLRGRDERLAAFPRTEAETRKHIAEYYAMVSHIDDRVGDLIDQLEQTGELDHTFIVLAGDNGLACGQHGLMGKQCCYEHSLHVPLLISGPGIAPNTRCSDLCYLHDIYPTLCDLTGTAIPESIEGRSLKPAMHGDSSNARRDLVFAMTQHQRAIRDVRWKLIETATPRCRKTQLFDLHADSMETADLSQEPAHHETVSRLAQSLRSQWEALDDNRPDQGADFWARMD